MSHYYEVGDVVACRCPHPIAPQFWWWIPGLVAGRTTSASTTWPRPPVYAVRLWLPDHNGWQEEVEGESLAPWPSSLGLPEVLPLPNLAR